MMRMSFSQTLGHCVILYFTVSTVSILVILQCICVDLV